MNTLGNESDEFSPCDFDDSNVETIEENILKPQLEINLETVSREEHFQFDLNFPQETSQICISENEVNLFSDDQDVFTDTYRQCVSEENDCSTYSEPDSIIITNLDNNTYYKDNSSLTSSQENNLLNLNAQNSEDNYFNSIQEKIMQGSIKSGLSITKALRNFKRVPIKNSLNSDCTSNQNDADNPDFKKSFDILSYTISIDGEDQNEIKCDKNNSKLGITKLENNMLSSAPVLMKLHHNIFQCEECGKVFKMKSHLISHFRAHDEDRRKFECNVCGLKFKTAVNFRFHLETHNKNPLNCPYCNKIFMARKVMSRHIRIVHSQNLYECDQCCKKFKTKKNLTDHYGIHSGVRPFSCQICSKTFLHKSSLNTHLREHYSQNCNQCMAHKHCKINDDTMKYDDPKSSVGCRNQIDCNENFHLKTDVSYVLPQKPFKCNTCKKIFKLRSSLLSHMKTHSTSLEYKCEECNKIFVKKISYELHMKKHRGERPEFMCDQCSQSYYSQFSLKRHYLKHTSEKSFHCQICSKTFWMKDALLVHLRSHSKQKNFKCNLCDKCFSHKSSLTSHVNSHHKDSSLPQVNKNSSKLAVILSS